MTAPDVMTYDHTFVPVPPTLPEASNGAACRVLCTLRHRGETYLFAAGEVIMNRRDSALSKHAVRRDQSGALAASSPANSLH
jgi:hypothetical protein